MTHAPADMSTVRRSNLRAVLRELVRQPGSRAALAQRTGLTKATVAALVEPLVAARVLVDAEPVVNGRGRPGRELRLHPRGPVAVGAEINVDHLTVAVLALDGRPVLSRRVEQDNRRREPAGLVREVAELVAAARDEAGRPVTGVCLAVPGILDGPRVVRAPNLPRLVGSAPGTAVAAVLGLGDVPVDNEATLAAQAHLWPHGAAGGSFVYVSGDVGIGAGLVVDGALYRGSSGFAGELGHVVVERAGPACGCGGQGCLEQYAGLPVLLRAAGRRSVPALLRALAAGDARAAAAVADAGAALGVALSSLLNVVDVPSVVLGGAHAELFEHLAPAVRAEIGRRVLSTAVRPVELHPSTIGSESAARGAAALVAQRVIDEPDGLLLRR